MVLFGSQAFGAVLWGLIPAPAGLVATLAPRASHRRPLGASGDGGTGQASGGAIIATARGDRAAPSERLGWIRLAPSSTRSAEATM